MDAVAEVKVLMNSYQAEYGKGSGAIINVVSKTGTGTFHGAGYDYPHDDPRAWVPQEYRPPELAGRVYYEPSDHGFEREVGERMRGHDERR